MRVLHNGVAIHSDTVIKGPTAWHEPPVYKSHADALPITLQDHGNPVRYRNIWYRPLPKRAIDGGEASHMTEAATAAKRAEIAKNIRESAAKLEGNEQMLHLFESLCYEDNVEARKSALAAVNDFARVMKEVPADKIASKKDEILKVAKALRYLTKFKILPEDIDAKKDLEAIIKVEEWEPKPQPKGKKK